ncbi:hypothetical protein [Aridibaculum aurantiacum]|nr:hypothetical protein [Aridibaculum aurantiacum]
MKNDATLEQSFVGEIPVTIAAIALAQTNLEGVIVEERNYTRN